MGEPLPPKGLIGHQINNPICLQCAEASVQTFLELLDFVISLVVSEGEGVHSDLDTFGLELLNAALNAGGPGLVMSNEAVLQLLRQEVWGALALAACRPNLATLSQACQVSTLLHLEFSLLAIGRGLLSFRRPH